MGCVNSLDNVVRTVQQKALAAGLDLPDGIPMSAGSVVDMAVRGDEFDTKTITPFPASYIFSKQSLRSRFTYQGPVNRTTKPLSVVANFAEAPHLFLVQETVPVADGQPLRIGIYNDSNNKHYAITFTVSFVENGKVTVAATGAGRQQSSDLADSRRTVTFEVDVGASGTEWAAAVQGGAVNVTDTTGDGVADSESNTTAVRITAAKQTDAVRLPRALMEERAKLGEEAKRAVATETETMRTVAARSKQKPTDTFEGQQLSRQCAKEKIPFVDAAFPPSDESIGTGESFPWRRPTQYLTAAQKEQVRLFRDISAQDIHQGLLGDCWLLCSCAALASMPSKVQRIFRHPEKAEYGRLERAVGAYNVTINKDGWWTTTVVDDYLPVDQIECIAPAFAHNSNDPCELWVPLLEKAFAKLYGSYGNVAEGEALYGLANLTGYPSVRLDSQRWKRAAEIVRVQPEGSTVVASEVFQLYSDLMRMQNGKALAILTTEGVDTTAYSGNKNGAGSNSASMADKFNKMGLPMGHAFTLLDVRCFPEGGKRAPIPFLDSTHDVPVGSLCMLQIFNPWGSGFEWTGAWGDNDAKWKEFPVVAESIKPESKADGAFWMEWTDVLRYFDGGGGSLVKRDWHDYRVKGSLLQENRTVSNIALEVIVEKGKSARGFAIMSQADRRGTTDHADYFAAALSVGRVEVTKGPNEVPATATSTMEKIMSSGAAKQQGEATIVECKPDFYATLNALEPVTHGSFVGARDVSMAYLFDATNATTDTESFFVVPRAHSSAATASSFVLGLLLDQEVGKSGVKEVRVIRLGAKAYRGESNHIILNSANINELASVTADAQYTSEMGIPVSKKCDALTQL